MWCVRWVVAVARIHINDQTLMKWLAADTAIAKQAALSLKAKHRWDVSAWRHHELILNFLHGNRGPKPRMPTFTCKKLMEALPPLLDGRALGLNVQYQVMAELRQHYGDSKEETYAFDAMMEEARDPDAVEHLHQVLEEHLDAPATQGPAVKIASSVPVSGLAFPSLFPLGTGHFESPRPYSVEWYQWGRALENFYDHRFATHGTFPCFVLNTMHRQQAFDDASLFMHKGPHERDTTVGDLQQLAHGEKVKTFKKLSAFAAHTQNSDGYWKRQKLDLLAAIDQLGDPTFFITHSHADTQCPYLANYIKVHAAIADGSSGDPTCPGLTPSQRYGRRVGNVIKYPHLVAEFFHLKTQLAFEYVGSCMGALAHWGRYEFQMRGSSHMHYFFWCKDAPSVHFLDQWVKEAVEAVTCEGQELTEEDMQAIVDECNEVSAKRCARTDETTEEAQALSYYAQRCTRWNEAWDDVANVPSSARVDGEHPAAEKHTPVPAGVGAGRLCEACGSVVDDRAELLNATNRHTSHNANYCLRKDKKGNVYCRFHFPQQAVDPNIPHFRAKLASGGIQWELYMPMNDPVRNTVNAESAASQRANTDCKPLIGHFSAVQYVCKYATKLESANESFQTSMARALSGFCKHGDTSFEEGEQEGDPVDSQSKPASAAYASFLIQQNGARNWSGQEVAHVLKGIPSTISSHMFRSFSTSNWHKVRKLEPDDHGELNPDLNALEPNKWSKYLGRMSTMWSMVENCDTTQTTLDGGVPMTQARFDCSK